MQPPSRASWDRDGTETSQFEFPHPTPPHPRMNSSTGLSGESRCPQESSAETCFILLLPSSLVIPMPRTPDVLTFFGGLSCAYTCVLGLEGRSSHSRCSRCSTARRRQTTFSASSHLFQVCCLGCTHVGLRRQPAAHTHARARARAYTTAAAATTTP